jgi:hypothetical protein
MGTPKAGTFHSGLEIMFTALPNGASTQEALERKTQVLCTRAAR